jgi:exodeoxyribonuclease-1
MAVSFFFYDLETSGLSPREARIMQFAGQRTDMDLQPIGEPVNELIKLTPDVLPEPDAVLLTGITPQATLADGLTEAEFLKLFTDTVATPETIFVGFNSVRFDDEFMRFLHYRNFYDPYEWQWKDGRGRWDMLDVIRMTRALRPAGIHWPLTPEGEPTNRLELMTKLNNLDHAHAHDALSDVYATISVAQLIREKQPKLFQYLLNHREKQAVASLVETRQPFVYSAGSLRNECEKTSVVTMLAKLADQPAALVYDLRFDPTPYLAMTPPQLAEQWKYSPDKTKERLPVYLIRYNQCPAIAPLSVVTTDSQKRIMVSEQEWEAHAKLLQADSTFAKRITDARQLLDAAQTTKQRLNEPVDVQLYNGFLDRSDSAQLVTVRTSKPELLYPDAFSLRDVRLKGLLPLYKARNFPKQLTSEEREVWDTFCSERLFAGARNSRMAKYALRLQQLIAGKLDANQQYLVEELRLYAESILPTELAG